MRYEDLLLNIANLTHLPNSLITEYFDSRTVSITFGKLAPVCAFPVPLSRPYPPQAFSIKRISGDLDRLYRMGLLNRKRVKRLLLLFRSSSKKKDSREGGSSNIVKKKFARGYMYRYSISKQGWSYIPYLGENAHVPRQERQKRRNDKYRKKFMDACEPIMQSIIQNKAPLPSMAVIAEERKSKLPRGDGIYERFPVQFDKGMYMRNIEERMEHQKTKTKWHLALSLADRAICMAQRREEIHEAARVQQQRLTPLQLILDAKSKLIKDNINPMVYLLGRPPAPPSVNNSQVESAYPHVPLLMVLDWAIASLS